MFCHEVVRKMLSPLAYFQKWHESIPNCLTILSIVLVLSQHLIHGRSYWCEISLKWILDDSLIWLYTKCLNEGDFSKQKINMDLKKCLWVIYTNFVPHDIPITWSFVPHINLCILGFISDQYGAHVENDVRKWEKWH